MDAFGFFQILLAIDFNKWVWCTIRMEQISLISLNWLSDLIANIADGHDQLHDFKHLQKLLPFGFARFIIYTRN